MFTVTTQTNTRSDIDQSKESLDKSETCLYVHTVERPQIQHNSDQPFLGLLHTTLAHAL